MDDRRPLHRVGTVEIGETITSADNPKPLPVIAVDEGTVLSTEKEVKCQFDLRTTKKRMRTQ